MTVIYAVDEEVFLQAPRAVLEEVVHAIEKYLDYEQKRAIADGMEQQLRLFANSLRAHAQHVPAKAEECAECAECAECQNAPCACDALTEQYNARSKSTEEWLDT